MSDNFKMNTVFGDIALGFLSAKDRKTIDNLWDSHGISTEIHFAYKRSTGYCHSLERKIIFAHASNDRVTEEHYISSQEMLSSIIQRKYSEAKEAQDD